MTYIIIYYLAGFTGLIFGIVIGMTVRKHQLSYKPKKRKAKNSHNTQKRRKNNKKKRKLQYKKKTNGYKGQKNSLLSGRIERPDSYASFVCEGTGIDSYEHVKKTRGRQDQKYKI